MPTNIGANSTERPGNPQGKEVELHLDPQGTGSTEAADKDGLITRDTIIQQATRWADTQVPYDMNAYLDGYRTDCSGYVSMAWNLSWSRTTQRLVDVCGRNPISKDGLQPGDVLIK